MMMMMTMTMTTMLRWKKQCKIRSLIFSGNILLGIRMNKTSLFFSIHFFKMSNLTRVKILYHTNQLCIIFSVEGELTMSTLRKKAKDIAGKDFTEPMVLCYKDADGDHIKINTDNDIVEALKDVPEGEKLKLTLYDEPTFEKKEEWIDSLPSLMTMLLAKQLSFRTHYSYLSALANHS
jgi:hypothetical protein